MGFEWWHWMVLGLLLGLAELIIPSFFIIWFGLGAILVGLVLLAVPGMGFTGQVVMWTIASVGLTVLWFKVFKKQQDKTRAGQADDVIGESGVLVRGVEPFQKGEVRFQRPVMGSEVWTCLADETIAAGERVRVVSVDGQVLKVARG